jgi:hypothetical protein
VDIKRQKPIIGHLPIRDDIQRGDQKCDNKVGSFMLCHVHRTLGEVLCQECSLLSPQLDNNETRRRTRLPIRYPCISRRA